jgi:drug/metabolite transporter (DMT)-like permease
MAIATLIMAFPFIREIKGQNSVLPRAEIKLAVLGGIFFAADLSFWATGIVLSGATNPTLMANTAPLWVGLGAMLFFGERLKLKFWIGLLITLIGASFVLGQDIQKAANFGLGTFLGLLAAIFYGGYFLFTQRGRKLLSSLSYFWIASASSSVMLFIVNLLLDQPLVGYSTYTYINFLSLGLIVQAVGWLAINYAQGYLPASIVSPTLLGQPVLTAVFSVPLLGESFTIWHIIGGIIVLVGVYIVHRSRGLR